MNSEQEREAFEAEARARGFSAIQLQRAGYGHDYGDKNTSIAWHWWRWARSSLAQPAPEPAPSPGVREALPPLPKFHTCDSPWKEFLAWSDLPLCHPDAGRLADAVDAALGKLMQDYVLADRAARAAIPATPEQPEWDDGDRFRWLTEDHANPDERAARDRIIASLPGRSLSGARIDIDANVADFVRKGMLATVDKWMADNRAATPPSPPQGGQEALTDTYVQPVPDKCDRITWRGRYYSLPIAPSPAPVQPEAADVGAATVSGAEPITSAFWQRIGDVIEDSLANYRCTHWVLGEDGEDGGMPLADLFTPAEQDSVAIGHYEMELLCDHLLIDLHNAARGTEAARAPASPSGADALDAARWRSARELGKSLKVYLYDDEEDATSGDWHYNPAPELMDRVADELIARGIVTRQGQDPQGLGGEGGSDE